MNHQPSIGVWDADEPEKENKTDAHVTSKTVMNDIGSAQAALLPFTESDVKQWRIQIDAYIAATDREFISSREISMAKTSLQRAKAWLGEVLKSLGTANPYPNSSDPNNKVIEPQAEHDLINADFTQYPTQLERVKAIRGSIQELINGYAKYHPFETGFAEKGLSLQNLIEAKHWFGWELDRIRWVQEGSQYPPANIPTSLF